MTLRVVADVIESRNWQQARSSIDAQFRTVTHDGATALLQLTKWSTYRYLLLAALWGILAPLEIFILSVGKVLGVLFFLGATAFPFIFAFEMVPKQASDPSALRWGVFGYAGFVLACLVLAVVRLLRMEGQAAPPRFKFVRANMANALFFISEILEFLQLSAIVLQLPDLPLRHAALFRDGANALLLNFLPYTATFWITFGLFLAWYFVASAPPLLEEVITRNQYSEGDISNLAAWKLAMSVLSNTLLVTLVDSFFKTVSCTAEGQLFFDASTPCWTPERRAAVLYALLGLMWYLTTAVGYGAKCKGCNAHCVRRRGGCPQPRRRLLRPETHPSGGAAPLCLQISRRRCFARTFATPPGTSPA